MNITLVATLDERTYRDGDQIHGSDFRLLFPTSVEQAAQLIADMRLEGRAADHNEWEIVILLDGRESTDENLHEEERIERLAHASVGAALARQQAEKERKEQEETARKTARAEAAVRRKEAHEWQEYVRLKAKFRSEFE